MRMRLWIVLVGVVGGVASLLMLEGKHDGLFAPPGHGIVVQVPAPNILRPPVVAPVQQMAAVPIGEIPSVPRGKVDFNGDARNPQWKIEGKWESTSDDARRAAYQQAQEELVSYLRSQEPPLKWVPPVSFIGDRRKKLVAKLDEETHTFPEIGTMRRYVLEMTLPTEARREIWQHECEASARQRMLFLAKVLAGLVSLLAATAGYLRLDELTKGYYTGWLRLAAAGLLGVAGLVLALLA